MCCSSVAAAAACRRTGSTHRRGHRRTDEWTNSQEEGRQSDRQIDGPPDKTAAMPRSPDSPRSAHRIAPPPLVIRYAREPGLDPRRPPATDPATDPAIDPAIDPSTAVVHRVPSSRPATPGNCRLPLHAPSPAAVPCHGRPFRRAQAPAGGGRAVGGNVMARHRRPPSLSSLSPHPLPPSQSLCARRTALPLAMPPRPAMMRYAPPPPPLSPPPQAEACQP